MIDSEMAAKSKLNDRLLGNFSAGEIRKEEQVTAGSSLLTFMNLASGNVKNALEKPANFKRNINHRRYLQKQLRNFGKRKPSEMILKKPKDVFKHKNNGLSGIKSGVSRNSSRQEGNSKKSEKNAFVGSCENPSLRDRNLPPSFWQEPFVKDVTETCMYPLYPGTFLPRAEDSEDPYNPATFETYFEGWSEFVVQPEVPTEVLSPCSESVGAPSLSSEEAIFDDFMTGEELTQNIDIKDLYVPELYIEDRSAHEHSYDESLYLAPISPSQYIFTPTTCSDQAYFNFTFDHDQSGLPPFAMAFLSPGSLAQY
ncbi:uncharacterized protein [Montipora foliosa]|uniref:uncharacterized protein n=1 Tax=Montipora foliosa TaxID=591990 RepID=UPI0035F2153C